jgi:phosphate acetyltransferase
MRLDDILSRASKAGRSRVAVVGAADPEVLRAVRTALDGGIAEPILIGAVDAIRAAAREGDVALDGMAIEVAEGDREASACAASLVRGGEVDALLKGSVTTTALMRAGLRGGLKVEGRLVTHIALVELPGDGRALAITDCALIPHPTFAQRVEIVRNAAACLSRLGAARPKIALLSASEEVNAKIPSSIEAARIAEMALPGGPLAGLGAIEGPLDFGCAIDRHAAEIKGVRGDVAGCADVIVAPDIVSANTLAKAFAYLGGSPVAACAVGGAVPIGMVSRASHAEDKLKALQFALACR